MRGATFLFLQYFAGHIYFNPRTPCGVRRESAETERESDAISIHAPHAGCDFGRYQSQGSVRAISIHAPHAGCDDLQLFVKRLRKISIHAPHAGCDMVMSISGAKAGLFQSTHPMRGATKRYERPRASSRHFNPRTPCGVRRSHHQNVHVLGAISIHAPHAGCDIPADGLRQKLEHFNPRTPCGVRQYTKITGSCIKEFQSTHPMRGATAISPPMALLLGNFNPRTPCGVRHKFMGFWRFSSRFQSTHPMRGATYGKNLSILPQVSASFPRSGKSALYLSGI